MSAIVTNKFRHNNAKSFYDSFGTDKYYLFVGRSESWANDNLPPVPADSVVSEPKHYRDMIAAKNVSTPDITYVIPRRNWVTATVYDMYHHNITVGAPASSGATNLWDSTFYVMNQNYNVYICISNNGGVASTVEPTGTSPNVFITSGDGYRWKYLYNISTSNVQKYLSLDFMPVLEDQTIANSAPAGAIEFIKLVNGGSGYVNGSYTSVPIHGDGAAGTVNVTIAGGIITTVTISAVGSGYTFASIDLTTYEDPNASTTTASIDPVISPLVGHGADNIKELGGFFVMINTTLAGADGAGDFLVNQDFRQVGLLKNPTKSNNPISSATVSCLKSLTLSSGFGNFVIDEVITGNTSGAIGIVSDFDSTTGILKYLQQSETGNGLSTDGDIDAFTTSDTLAGATSGASGTVTAVTLPEIDVYSGDIIYIENRMPIPRATDQQENIKLIVEF